MKNKFNSIQFNSILKNQNMKNKILEETNKQLKISMEP